MKLIFGNSKFTLFCFFFRENSGRLRRKILTPADTQENRPIKGDYVKVSIKGTFEGEVFEEEPDLEFLSEEGETFRALELIVALMYPGETDEFIADPELVYGKIGDFTSFF